jgi:hypothetical protein
VLVSVIADGRAKIENEIDWLLIAGGNDPDRLIITTSYPDDSLADVIKFAQNINLERITTVGIVCL